MTIIECNRCGLTDRDTTEDLTSFYEVTATAKNDDQRWDLCPHCYTELVNRFMIMNVTKETVPHE